MGACYIVLDWNRLLQREVSHIKSISSNLWSKKAQLVTYLTFARMLMDSFGSEGLGSMPVCSHWPSRQKIELNSSVLRHVRMCRHWAIINWVSKLIYDCSDSPLYTLWLVRKTKNNTSINHMQNKRQTKRAKYEFGVSGQYQEYLRDIPGDDLIMI